MSFIFTVSSARQYKVENVLKRTPWGELQRIYSFTIDAMQFSYLFKTCVHVHVSPVKHF